MPSTISTVWSKLRYREIDVRIDDQQITVKVRLKIKDKLSSVRGRLKESKKINMGDTLSFAKTEQNSGTQLVDKKEENEISLKSIVGKKRILYLRTDSANSEKCQDGNVQGIKIQIGDSSTEYVVMKNLNINDNLLKVRKRLEQDSDSNIKMEEVSFAKASQGNSGSLAEIAREDEEMINLN